MSAPAGALLHQLQQLPARSRQGLSDLRRRLFQQGMFHFSPLPGLGANSIQVRSQRKKASSFAPHSTPTDLSGLQLVVVSTPAWWLST